MTTFQKDEADTPSSDIICIEDDFYIKASSALADRRTHVLKDNDLFAVFDRYGDIQPVGYGDQGLFYESTRFLSRFEMRLNSCRLLLLGSEVKSDNMVLVVDLTNPDFFNEEEVALERDNIHIFRSASLWNSTCYQRFRFKNYHTNPISFDLSFAFGADFADIFEVRGLDRKKRGQLLSPNIEDSSVILSYAGLDKIERKSSLHFSKKPHELTGEEAHFYLDLKPKETTELLLTITFEREHLPKQAIVSYSEAHLLAQKKISEAHATSCNLFTSNEQFNDWVNTSFADLQMMLTDKKTGPYPYAGVPWFCTAFGRDAIITALESLWINPNIAKGTLAYLSATQAKDFDPEKDAEPGKILHETRTGEMASLKEIPFGLYYGSIDATLLFVVLAGAYYKRTADKPFLEHLWPSIELALHWIQECGDIDGDGFIEYQRHAKKGLIHQGWKDSQDSVFHSDGTLAPPPIALSEVQAYLYAAYGAAITIAQALQKHDLIPTLEKKAEMLREAFNQVFWCEDIATYALAIDGNKKPCEVNSSNAGQCLFSSIAKPEYAKTLSQTLFREEMFSGWGIRTISSQEKRFNPMSYHNGSVWPHDNALIALGLKRYGFNSAVMKLLTCFFDASLYIEQKRLPELFCGFSRRPKEGPTPYPVACVPQSWAAGSVFMLLQATLGLTFNAEDKRIFFSHPALPPFLNFIQLKNLRIGKHSCDLLVQQQEGCVSVNLLQKSGDITITIEQ